MSDNRYYVKLRKSWEPSLRRLSAGLRLGLVLLIAGACAAQTWHDEFNGPKGTRIDARKWTFDTGSLHVNNELEIYCAPTTATPPCDPKNPNAFLDGNGHLVIRHRLVDQTWTSARLKTQGLRSFRYGRLEARIKVPSHAGIWPAFWTLGSNIAQVDWPACGEIDILENWPEIGPRRNVFTLHGKGYSGGAGISFRYDLPNQQRVDTDFHTYGIIWARNKIQFYFDEPANVVSVRTPKDLPAGTKWLFNHPFFLIVNLAIGGDLGGPPDAGTATTEPMLIDYIRYYE